MRLAALLLVVTIAVWLIAAAVLFGRDASVDVDANLPSVEADAATRAYVEGRAAHVAADFFAMKNAEVARNRVRLIPKAKPRSAPTVHVATASPWDALQRCECPSGWHCNTGNGYFGGLQMNMQFWRSYGGPAYAERPDLASREQQIAVAERARATRGYRPWPTCARRLGLI